MGTERGQKRHATVPPDRWCMSFADIKQFRLEVVSSMKTGAIFPTDQDDFDLHDFVFGPNIYTVTQQLIKPVTLAAGGVSWALMVCPGGHRCDIFVSHTWAEGVFEFVDKLFASWPRFAKFAYCCMLSNPQNLDISAMLKTPRTSPFAIALRSAKYVLVVPNQNCSVYTRLWCVYEAFLACEMNKTIIMAHSPSWGNLKVLKAMSWMFLSSLVGIIFGWLTLDFMTSHLKLLGGAVWLVVLLPGIISGLYNVHWLVHAMGVGISSYLIILLVWLRDDSILVMVHGHSRYYRDFVAIDLLLFFLLLEFDRARRDVAHLEAAYIERGWTGKVRTAKCSMPCDESQIWQDIGGREASVDEAISLLKNAGMWTDRIRSASIAGVQIHNLCDYGYAWHCCSFFFSVGQSVKLAVFNWVEQPHWVVLAVIVTFFWLYHLLRIFCHFEQDQRAFGCVIASKFAILRAFEILPIWILDTIKVTDVDSRSLAQFFCLFDLCNWTAQIVFMEAGLDRVAQYFGPYFTEMLLWKLNSENVACCPKSPEQASNGSEDSNTDSDMSIDEHSADATSTRNILHSSGQQSPS